MPMQNPYEQYQRNKILTATPSEVTLMLYEGAIKFCNIAIMAIESNDMEKAHVNIMKTQRIIEEFRNTLDRKYELRRLFDANIKKDKEILEEVNGHLRSLRDTWKEVMKKCNKA